MTLNEITRIDEYYLGRLSPMDKAFVLGLIPDSIQQRYHIVIKNGGPTAFIFMYEFDVRHRLYILVDHKSQDYFGYANTIKVSDDIIQISDVYLEPSIRGMGLARHIYAFISAANSSFIINSKQLSTDSEKLWKGFSNLKIFNTEHKKFYNILDVDNHTIIDPKDDTNHENQTWFYAYKEDKSILDSYKYVGEGFDYDRFLCGQNGKILENGKSIPLIPMTPIYDFD